MRFDAPRRQAVLPGDPRIVIVPGASGLDIHGSRSFVVGGYPACLYKVTQVE
jgi:hypothetical protein